MRKSPLIEPVYNSDDKRFTYSIAVDRFKKAMNEGFYLEALLIDGALVEDRINSLLYYIGVFEQRNVLSPNLNISRLLIENAGCRSNKDHLLSVASLDAKLNLVKKAINWSEGTSVEPNDPVLGAIWTQLHENVDAASLSGLVDQANAWRDSRNEIVHALVNKHLEALAMCVPDLCDEGYALFREFDKFVRQFSGGNRIRKALGFLE